MGNYIPIVSQWFFKVGATAGGPYYLSYGLLGISADAPVGMGGTSIMSGTYASILGG